MCASFGREQVVGGASRRTAAPSVKAPDGVFTASPTPVIYPDVLLHNDLSNKLLLDPLPRGPCAATIALLKTYGRFSRKVQVSHPTNECFLSRCEILKEKARS